MGRSLIRGFLSLALCLLLSVLLYPTHACADKGTGALTDINENKYRSIALGIPEDVVDGFVGDAYRKEQDSHPEHAQEAPDETQGNPPNVSMGDLVLITVTFFCIAAFIMGWTCSHDNYYGKTWRVYAGTESPQRVLGVFTTYGHAKKFKKDVTRGRKKVEIRDRDNIRIIENNAGTDGMISGDVTDVVMDPPRRVALHASGNGHVKSPYRRGESTASGSDDDDGAIHGSLLTDEVEEFHKYVEEYTNWRRGASVKRAH